MAEAPSPRWLVTVGVLALLVMFVLSFAEPFLLLVLLIPFLLGIYIEVRSPGPNALGTPMILVSLVFAGARVLLPAFALTTIAIRSSAMEPAIGAGQRVLFNRTGIGGMGIGDIVAFHPPRDAHRKLCGPLPHTITPGRAACSTPEPQHIHGFYIRRIIAQPGDVISIVEGDVIRNGVRERDSYTQPCGPRTQCSFPTPIKVPAGMWFLLADNRRESDDSRFFGPVPRSWIIGVAIMSVWPLDEADFL